MINYNLDIYKIRVKCKCPLSADKWSISNINFALDFDILEKKKTLL